MMRPKIGKKMVFHIYDPENWDSYQHLTVSHSFAKLRRRRRRKKNQNISTHMRPGFDAVADPLILQRAELYNTYTLCWTCEIESKHNI